jgi:rubrerythrin
MTASRIDFATLSLQDLLDLAILIEEEARDRYEEFAHQMDVHRTPEAASFFRFMAGNEARHGIELAARRTQLYGDAPSRMSRAMLWDVEAPEYDEARAFMTPRQAMETALRAEQKAHAYFVDALRSVRDPTLRALLEEFRDDEVRHQELVRQEIAKHPPDPAVDPEDFTDEPTSQ